MSERSFYRWKERCENAKSGPLCRFREDVTHASADRLALLAARHYHLAVGGFVELPTYDKFFNLVCDQSGKPVTVRKLMMPNPRAMWRELALLDPETYGRQDKRNAVVYEPPASQQCARPLDLVELFASVGRRMKALGIDFEPAKPAIETSATPVDPTTES